MYKKNIALYVKLSRSEGKLWSGFRKVKNKIAAIAIQKPDIYVQFSNGQTSLDHFIQKISYVLLFTKWSRLV
jgi:hypothetical protein